MLLFNILFSLCLASFSGVVALRLPLGQTFLNSRSCCDYCGHQLAWYHLIPLISYLCLRGHCAYCGHQIHPDIFIIEIIGLIVALEASFQSTYNSYALILLLITVAMNAITDIFFLSIWPITLVPSIVATLILQFPNSNFWLHWIALAVIFSIFYFLCKNKFGFGDIEIILLIALLLGIKLTLEIILLTTLIIIIYLIGQPQKLNSNLPIAFIPFLLIAFLLRMAFYCWGFCQ
ncbi:prepilin peptidase [Bombilactobacillus bombi]|uniref:prepilin peptidase n=1 Tax=Bombilactobacillus bombi TaxID=1303590 RepID=UPI0015E5A210|nr:prepilin peptidase [Bombilactobacillus bombi]MBA1434205.1 prepilin peptidase [Bombilactobacillus bombi]